MIHASRSLAGILLLIASSLPVLASHGPADAGLKRETIKPGSGPEVVRHATLKVNYTGWLADGTRFDSNLDRGSEPFEFQVGTGQVIPGWDLGLPGTRQGETMELVVPPQLAYGARGAGDMVPPNETLRFEIEILEVRPPRYANIDNDTLAGMLKAGVKLFDIRRPEEWEQTGVVDGSILLTAFDENGRLVPGFPERLARQVTAGDEFMLICRTGNRTSVIAEALTSQAGYQHVFNVTDGIVGWIGEGLPVTRP